MEKLSRYYLFKAGRLVGPVTLAKIEELRKSKEIYQYSWMMDETSQTWRPIDEMPKENPFQATLNTLKERVLNGAFLFREQMCSGVIRGIHSFGLELMLPISAAAKLIPNSVHVLNLIDETNLKSSNTEVIFQGQEKTSEGTLLRFTWRESPSPL